MKKVTITCVLLACIALFGSKAFIALFSYQTLEAMQQSLDEDVAISYSWLSSDFNGSVTVHDVVIRPYSLKRSYYAESVELSYSNYLALVLGLLDLKQGDWDNVEQVRVNNVRIPLEGRDLEEWLALEFDPAFAMPLTLYACKPYKRVSKDALQKMGIDELRADLQFDVNRDSVKSDLFELRVSLDLHELGLSDLTLVLDRDTVPSDISQLQLNQLSVASLTFSHIERGYFRRLSNLCTREGVIDRSGFAQLSALEWKQALGQLGFGVGAELQQFYSDYLMLGGQITLALSPQKSLALNKLEDLIEHDLIEKLGLSAELNGEKINLTTLPFGRTYFGVKPIPVQDEKPKEDVAEKLPEKAFWLTPWEELSGYLGQKVIVRSVEGKAYEGMIKAVDEKTLHVTYRVQGGELSYQFKTSDVEQIEVWR